MKKILAIAGALALAVLAAPAFMAFEAHVVNVTATIENALSVPVEPITFGTVFPQEQLERTLGIQLSDSFIAETDADDVNYIIRQKPKCGVTSDDGTVLVGPTWTGHVVPTLDDQNTTSTDESNGGTAYTIDCEVDKPANVTAQGPYLLPSLCEYISKHPDNLPENDGSLNSFHQPFVVSGGQVDWTDVSGRLAKSEHDESDTWTIDLKVPCFGGYCAQDWADFVYEINPSADPSQYTQPIGNEHKVFGCNLWVEVTGVSRLSTPD